VQSKLVNVVVTCTARKTQKASPELMMRNLRRDDLVHRFRDWRTRLAKANPPRKRAIDLYCGNSWSIIRSLSQDAGLKVSLRIWVASAGAGLIDLDELLTAYDATFSPGQDDSVIPPELSSHGVNEWWDLLAESRKQQGAKVSRIANIAELYPDAPLIVAVSNEYLRAVAHDIETAQSIMADADRLIVIAAGASKSGKLAKNYLPCDARLENHFGRSRMALNARILKLILTKFPAGDLRASRLKVFFDQLLASLPNADYPHRKPSDDEAVISFILKHLTKNKRASYTGLLRLYRSTGRACEQKRFRGLFHATTTELKESNLI